MGDTVPATDPCPKCRKGQRVPEVRGYDNRSVETVVWIVCSKECGWEVGPWKL